MRNAFWSLGLPCEFERICKRITHMAVEVDLEVRQTTA